MACRACESEKQRELPSEINIHPPPGLENLDRACVLAVPTLLVCFDCGFAEFVLEEGERTKLYEHYGNETFVGWQGSSNQVWHTLRILPICAACKRIREKDGTWIPLDEHVTDHT